jgi:Transposase DDE domain
MEGLDPFLTLLYVTVNDLCKFQDLCLPAHPGPAPKLACSEVITLSLLGQWARFSNERGLYRFAQRHLRAAFPTLPDRSQFLRQEHACVSLIEQVACLLAAQRPETQQELYHILDATGVPVRHIKRRGGGWLAGTADKGWCSRISSSMGFHVLLAITESGFVTDLGFSPASVHDTRLAETFLGARANPSPRLPGVGPQAKVPYVADRAFAAESLQVHWLHDYRAAVLTQPHSRKLVAEPSPQWRRWMHSIRQVIETVSGKLPLTFRLATDRLHTLPGFRARLAAKVACTTSVGGSIFSWDALLWLSLICSISHSHQAFMFPFPYH